MWLSGQPQDPAALPPNKMSPSQVDPEASPYRDRNLGPPAHSLVIIQN